MNIDTERLITEVRLRPVIWDLASLFYKDRDAKISAWKEVCKELIPDFEDKSDSEQKDIEKQVQQRWKTARDAYVRCKATLKNVPSGSGGKKRKTYVYFEFMKFLDNKRELNTEDSTLSNEELKQNETAGNEGAVEAQPTKNPGTVEPQSSTSDNSNINRCSQRPASNPRPKFTRTRQKNRNEDEFDREMLTFFKENAKVMQNDDMAFFCSLLPITKTFSIEQKLIFRQGVLQKAFEILRLGLDRPGTSHSSSSDSQHINSVTLCPVVDHPGTSHSFTSSDSQHTNSVTLYPVEDRPGITHSFTLSDSQHTNSVALYPVVQSNPFQTLPVKEAKSEWKKLRDNHRDSLKRMKITRSGQAATNINTWKYAELMEFLLPYMKNRSRSTNLNSTNTQSSVTPESPEVQDDEDAHHSEMSVLTTNDRMSNMETETLQSRTETRKRKANGDVIELLKEMEQNHQKRREDRYLRRALENSQKEKNAIDLFLESMAITIKTMPTWMQNRIKKKIFLIVSDAEEELENYSVCVTPDSVNSTLPAAAGSSRFAHYGYSISGDAVNSTLPAAAGSSRSRINHGYTTSGETVNNTVPAAAGLPSTNTTYHSSLETFEYDNQV